MPITDLPAAAVLEHAFTYYCNAVSMTRAAQDYLESRGLDYKLLLTVGDVDLAAGTVYVTGGGKTDSRTLALKASQVLLIDGYVRKERRELRRAAPRGQRSERGLLTNTGKPVGSASLNELVNAGRSDEERLRPPLVRQTVIAGLLEAGHDVRVVQAFARHRTATATEQYRVGGLKELARAVRALHPRG